MRLIVDHLGACAPLDQFLSTLSSCPSLALHAAGPCDDPMSLVRLVLIDEAADVTCDAIRQRCTPPGNLPTIVIDLRYDGACRERYLDMGLVDYLDYAALDIGALERTIGIVARTQRFAANGGMSACRQQHTAT